MSRKQLIYLAVAIAVLFAMGGGAVGAALYYRDVYRPSQWLAEGNEAFAAGNWRQAKISFSSYLSKNPQDAEVLKKYAECNLNSLSNRPNSLREAATAYRQMLQILGTSDPTVLQTIYGLYEKAEDWPNLEYFAGVTLERDPENEEALYYRALANDRMDRRREAIALYEQLISSGTRRAEVYGNLAQLYIRDNVREKGAAVLEAALAQFPDDALIHLERHKFLKAINDVAGSKEALAKARALAPEHLEVLIAVGIDALGERNAEDALAIGRRVIDMAPDRGEGYGIVASALQRQGDSDGALATIESMDPLVRIDYPNLMVSQAELLIGMERYDDARKVVDAYVAAFPVQLPMKEYFSGRIALATGDFDEAITRLTIAKGSLPMFPNISYFLGLAYLRDGQREQARIQLDAYLRLNPYDQSARLLVLREFPEQGTGSEAETLARELMTSPGGSAMTLVTTAVSMFDAAYRKRTHESMSGRVQELLQEAISREPALGEAYSALADVLVLLGKLDEAARVLDRAEQAGATMSPVLISRGNLALARNDVDAAVQQWESARSSGPLTAMAYTNWMQLFERRRYPELADKVYEAGSGALEGEEAVEFELQRLEQLVRRNALDDALALVETLKPKTQADEGRRVRLSLQELDLAERLIFTNEPEKIAAGGAIVDAAYAADANNTRAKVLRGELLARQTPGDVAGARALFTEVLTQEPNNVPALLGMANALRREGNTEGALTQCMTALSANPDSVAARLLAGELMLEQNRIAEARSMVGPVLERDPGDLRAARLLLLSYQHEGETDRIATLLDRVEAAVQGDPVVLQTLADWRTTLLSSSGGGLEPIDELRKQYEENRDSLAVARRLALALARSGEFAEGESILRAYVAQHDDSAEAWASLATLYMASPDPAKREDASAALTRAMLREPDHPYVLREMVRLQILLGNASEALAYSDRYLAQRPNDLDVLYRKAMVLASQRRFTDALDAINVVITSSNQPMYVELRGFINTDLGRYDAALADLTSAESTSGRNSGQVAAALAECYAGTGQLTEAKSYYDKAREALAQGESVDQVRIRRVEMLLREKGAIG